MNRSIMVSDVIDFDRFRIFVMLIVIQNFPQCVLVDRIKIMFRNIHDGPVTLFWANIWIYLDISNTIQLFCCADLGLEMTKH